MARIPDPKVLRPRHERVTMDNVSERIWAPSRLITLTELGLKADDDPSLIGFIPVFQTEASAKRWLSGRAVPGGAVLRFTLDGSNGETPA